MLYLASNGVVGSDRTLTGVSLPAVPFSLLKSQSVGGFGEFRRRGGRDTARAPRMTRIETAPQGGRGGRASVGVVNRLRLRPECPPEFFWGVKRNTPSYQRAEPSVRFT